MATAFLKEKVIELKQEIRFIDSFKLMTSSLDNFGKTITRRSLLIIYQTTVKQKDWNYKNEKQFTFEKLSTTLGGCKALN